MYQKLIIVLTLSIVPQFASAFVVSHVANFEVDTRYPADNYVLDQSSNSHNILIMNARGSFTFPTLDPNLYSINSIHFYLSGVSLAIVSSGAEQLVYAHTGMEIRLLNKDGSPTSFLTWNLWAGDGTHSKFIEFAIDTVED